MRRASNIAAMLAISLVVVGLGGVHTAVAGAAAVLALAAAALAVLALRSRDHDVLVSFVGVALTAGAAACFAQLVPLPASLHAIFNPTGLSIYESACSLARIDPSAWRPLSLDPHSTADRALRFIALAALAIWGANVREKRAWGRFAHVLVPLALVDLVLGFALHTTGATSFLGLYEPEIGFRGPSTFLSTNHGALFFGFVSIVSAATALGLRRDQPRRAAAFGAFVPLFAGAALSQQSDGVALAMVATVSTAVVVQWLRLGRPRKVETDVKIGVVFVAVLGLIAALWLDLHRLAATFLGRVALSGEHGARFELLDAGTSAMSDFWPFGAGAGAIESVLPAYVDWSAIIPASIPLIENDTLELLLAFGVPLGLLMVGACVYQIGAVLGQGTDGHRSPRYAVAIVSAVYLGLLAQLHFPLFALGIGMPAVVWFELLWSRRRKSTGGERFFKSGHVALDRRVAAGLLAVLTVGGLLCAQAYLTWYAPAPELAAHEEVVHEIWLRPASHVPYVKLATEAVRKGEAEHALALADFAVLREPSPRVRLYRAQIEAAVDVERGAKRFAELFDEGHKEGRYLERFLIAVPDNETRVAVLESHPAAWDDAARRIQAADGSDATSSFVVGLATRRPGDLAVYRLAAATYLRLDQPVLSRLWAELVRDAEERQSPSELQAPLHLARALRASGEVDAARRVLDEAAGNPAVVRAAHREALTLRGAPSEALIEFVQRHHAAYCVSPVPAGDQRICWMSEAWLPESQRDFTAAEQVFMRVRRRMSDPNPLAEFYVRTGKCDDLEALARDIDPGPSRTHVETVLARCSRRTP